MRNDDPSVPPSGPNVLFRINGWGVMLTDVLLFLACLFGTISLWKVVSNQGTIIATVNAQGKTIGDHSKDVAAIEKARLIQAEEIKFFLSRLPGAPRLLEVPESLWDKLQQADRDALRREIGRGPRDSGRGFPRRKPTDG